MKDRLRRRLDPDARYGLRVTLFAVAFLMVAIPFGMLLDQVENDRSLIRLDTSAANYLHGWVLGSENLVQYLKILTFFGSPLWFYVLVTPAAIWVWRRGHARLAIFLVVTALGGGCWTPWSRRRSTGPDRRSSIRWPPPTAKASRRGTRCRRRSSTGRWCLFFLPVIGRRYRPVVIGGAVLLVLAIGFSRLALGVHYITDVAGGFVLGLAWLAASTAAFSIWRVEMGRSPVDLAEGLEPEAAEDLV